eukprot:363429-Chlamydomonas_euryale.AAC.11
MVVVWPRLIQPGKRSVADGVWLTECGWTRGRRPPDGADEPHAWARRPGTWVRPARSHAQGAWAVGGQTPAEARAAAGPFVHTAPVRHRAGVGDALAYSCCLPQPGPQT